jgi:DNA mismatch repair protein MutS2
VAALSLRGDEILLALGSRLPPALDAILKDTIAHAHRELRSRTGCDLQPLRAGFPLTVDEQEVERAERELEGSGRRQAFQAQVRAARQLQPLVAELTQEARAWLAFDADFALGCFALAHDLREPTFGDRLSLRDSIHLELADPAAIADGSHQAITYELGGQHPVAVLTGANSGGKTTLLEHVCQVVAMARLGLPVVGEATVPWVDEIHYVTARKGLDAGAFEAFLRTFMPVLQGSRRRLVLADEVEAVTELESAGRILGFFADRAARAGIPTILVTHMAPQILQHASEAASGRIRVDGIEATGLDEQHRLIVDRVPRMGHFARSTPELIVQRLAATTRGAEGELFAELARTLASGGRGAALPDSGDGHVAAPGPLASRRRTRPA